MVSTNIDTKAQIEESRDQNTFGIQLTHIMKTIANDHAMSARFCALESLMRCSAPLANAVNRCASGWPAVANAHAVPASSCALKSLMHCCTALAKQANKAPSHSP